MDPEEVTVGDEVPHINHRRGDTRRRSKQSNQRYWTNIGHWNRDASRYYRAAVQRTLTRLRVSGFDLEACEDAVFPLANEIDNYWYYD
jgi:hypothetical protein